MVDLQEEITRLQVDWPRKLISLMIPSVFKHSAQGWPTSEALTEQWERFEDLGHCIQKILSPDQLTTQQADEMGDLIEQLVAKKSTHSKLMNNRRKFQTQKW